MTGLQAKCVLIVEGGWSDMQFLQRISGAIAHHKLDVEVELMRKEMSGAAQ